MDIEIQDHALVHKNIVNGINIAITNLIFNKSATFRVRFISGGNVEGEPLMITIEGDEYLGWNNNDDYIIDLILNKLNLKHKGSESSGIIESTLITKSVDGTTNFEVFSQ